MAGITINALTGSDTAPAKANEAEQQNDIGTAKDQIGLTAINAKTEAYDAAYVGNGISGTEASNSVGRAVIKAVAEQIQANNQVGKATITITGYGTIDNITNDAVIIIKTRDFTEKGTITFQDGILTWEEQLELISSKKGEGVLSSLTDANPHPTKLKDAKGNTMVVPAGFEISDSNGTAENVAEGIIIQDESGNQFVWVPIGTIIKADDTIVTIPLGRYSIFTLQDGKYKPVQDASNGYVTTTSSHVISGNYYEFKNDTESTNVESATYGNPKAKDIQAFVTSAVANKGFYIARYEAGINGTTSSNTDATQGGLTKNSTTSGYIVSRSGVGVWNKISQPNAATVCQNMYTSSTNPYVTSDLVNSYAWDTAIIFIQQCSDTTNYYRRSDNDKSLKKTGQKGDDKCHINDMASNVREWITESCIVTDFPCVGRGGHYNGTPTACQRTYTSTSGKYDNFGFRPLLYL